MINRIFLDVDGVLANFSKGCCQACHVDYPQFYQFPDTWLDEKCPDMWKYCRGYDFWFDLEVFPWALDLRNIIAKYTDDWRFLTKPSFDPGCYAGKYDWIKKNFSKDISRLWIANGDKSAICRGGRDLLIDDKLKNLNAWRNAGGIGYHWTEVTPDWPREKVMQRLDEIRDILVS